ncbi:MAG TPA: hypothetical protein VLA43_19465 [Longimicrobiales bacterium]|nr:hypothetical protein [Longimicrobiales bacterium]
MERVWEYYVCRSCGQETFCLQCALCEGEVEFAGFKPDIADDLWVLQRVTGVPLAGRTPEEVAELRRSLVACPLCDARGFLQNLERRIWMECPHCWGAKHTLEDRFDPTQAPGFYDIAAAMMIHYEGANRLKGHLP